MKRFAIRSRKKAMFLSMAVLVCLGLFAGQAQAVLSLVTDSPLMMDGGTTSGPMLLSVVNDNAAPPPEENLTGWMTTLRILPEGGSTGSVGFDSVALPANYILDGINFGLIEVISSNGNPNDNLFAFDFNEPFSGGAQVPTAPGAGLLDMSFVASANASGTFGVYAVTSPTDITNWTDNTPLPPNGSGPTEQSFVNIDSVPGQEVLNRIGEIQVQRVVVDGAVPEPVTALMGVIGLSVLGMRVTGRQPMRR